MTSGSGRKASKVASGADADELPRTLASMAAAAETTDRGRFNDASRGEYVYRQVRDAIQDGVYKQGTRIREEEVARELGVSRTPVREGLRRLESHGLLQFAGGRGLVVASLTKKQIIELYAVMEMLDGSAARFAAQNASTIEIEMARHVLEVFDSVEGDPKRLARLNHEFHDSIYAAAHNEYLQKSLERLWDALASVPRTTYEVASRPANAAAEHWAILHAIELRHPDEAEWAARKHIREVQRVRIQMLFGGEV